MLCMALMLLYGMPASAQTSHGISGKVTDQTGNGIAGASVIVKGTTTGTSTGSDGSYSLNVKDGNATLVCSFPSAYNVCLQRHTILCIYAFPLCPQRSI